MENIREGIKSSRFNTPINKICVTYAESVKHSIWKKVADKMYQSNLKIN